MKFLLLVTVFISLNASATWINPEDIRMTSQIQQIQKPNFDEKKFQLIIAQIQTIYSPIVKNLGGRLNISGNWKKNNVFAGTTQIFKGWTVQITGGLARNPKLTADGMSLILCHELGHHLAGYSFAAPSNPIQGTWASNEGQADFFASHVCAKKLWQNELEENAAFRTTASATIKNKCDSVWQDSNQKDLCYRILAAAESVSNTMAVLKGESTKPDFNKPDLAVVNKTYDSHPATQCRMDTSLQGALCLANFDDSIIPGKNFPRRFENIESEKEAAQYNCTKSSGYSIGLRPACWFKARL